MNIYIDASSRQAVFRLKNLRRLTRAGIEYASFQSARSLQQATSREILKRPKKGRTYIRRTAGGRRRRHIASAPGETHANMTGRLRRSLSFRVSKSQILFGYGVQKNDAPEYAGFVEFGTRRMLPRPSLRNGIISQRRNFQNNFDRQIGKRLGARVTR